MEKNKNKVSFLGFPFNPLNFVNGTCFDFWCGAPSQIIGKLKMKMQDDASLFTAVWRTGHIVGIHKVYHNMYSNKVHQKNGFKVIPRAFNKSLPGIYFRICFEFFAVRTATLIME